MTRRTTPQTSLENLKKEAKRRLKALHSDQPEASKSTLREVQHLVAREYGFSGWTELKNALAARPKNAGLINRFLEYACPDHHVRSKPVHAMARSAAVRLLTQHPELARANFYTAIVCGEIELVAQMLRADPELVRRKSGTGAEDRSGAGSAGDLFQDIGPKDWEPLLFCCFARLPVRKAQDNAVRMAKLLLDAGADANCFFMGGMSRYTPLVGVIGEGEESRPAHPHRDELVRMLLERGAHPYDLQVVYNIHFEGKALWFLQLMHEFSAKQDWDDAEWKMLDMGRYGSGARYFVELARKKGDRELEEWCFSHGANPQLEIAPPEEALKPGDAIFAAAQKDDAEAVARLLDSGVPLEIEAGKKMRLLHMAAHHDSVRVAALLIERGAEMDPVEENYSNTPMGFAVYHDFPRMVELLAPRSRDIWNLVFTGHVARLREVLEQTPDAGPLFWLPDDERKAEEIVVLFVELGADVGIRNRDGRTAADMARRRGLIHAAKRLEAAATRDAYRFDDQQDRMEPRRKLSIDEWEVLIRDMEERRVTRLAANGFVTDEVLKRIAKLEFVTHLELGGSRELSDSGLKHLARMPQLRYLNLNEHPGGKLTDGGLAVLRELPELRTFEMTWQTGISDAGAANLKYCEKLESVNLMGTPTGDATIAALRGKVGLGRFSSGKLVTDAGLAMLHEFPRFAQWQDGETTRLLIDGPFTNKGLALLAGLDGVYELDLFWHATEITTDGYEVLTKLPNLNALGCDGALCDDRGMLVIAALPKLRKLRAQNSAMTDEGYIALSRSATIEDFWGREAPHLTGKGFAALAAMASLKKLGVSCKNAGEAALSLLPRFPALRELTTIDIEDDGFRYVGQCEQLERVACMYCRETTDAATEHIRGLGLTSYYAGKTKITDRSLEILSGMDSLEHVEFWECDGITAAGLRLLERLPKLREVKCKLSSGN